MAKAYWLSCYRAVHDADALAAYAKIAGPAVTAGGGRFLARGGRQATKEAGLDMRTVIVEFDSFDAALAAYDSPAYKAALEKLAGGAVERDLRIVEGLD